MEQERNDSGDNDFSKTEFNLNKIKTSIIGNHISNASNYYIQKNYVNCFLSWKAIKLLISNRLEEKEKKVLKKYEISMFNKGTTKTNGGRSLIVGMFCYYLDLYIEKINQYLKQIGLDLMDKSEQGEFS